MNRDFNFWNKLRILVTNKCNYRCPFCHNEGQTKDSHGGMMRLDDFTKLIDIIKGQTISELHFSGGEPFLNPHIVDMIEYVDNNTDWGLGCATNLSLISEEQISRLAKTRVKFNIQYPYADSEKFHISTGRGYYNHILKQIELIKSSGLRIGLNTVIQKDDLASTEEVINFALSNELPLKLLPQIGLEGSDHFKEMVYPILERLAVSVIDKGTGALRWTLEKEGKKTTVLYIDSPCFNKDIETCREFGELRILPDLRLQPCIFKDSDVKINLEDNAEDIINQMTELWKNFKHC